MARAACVWRGIERLRANPDSRQRLVAFGIDHAAGNRSSGLEPNRPKVFPFGFLIVNASRGILRVSDPNAAVVEWRHSKGKRALFVRTRLTQGTFGLCASVIKALARLFGAAAQVLDRDGCTRDRLFALIDHDANNLPGSFVQVNLKRFDFLRIWFRLTMALRSPEAVRDVKEPNGVAVLNQKLAAQLPIRPFPRDGELAALVRCKLVFRIGLVKNIGSYLGMTTG
jgi:hypothetical protein